MFHPSLQTSKYLFIASNYRQLSADSKMKKDNNSFVNPKGAKDFG